MLVQQASNNTKEQFSNSPDLASGILYAIMDALTAHSTMSKQALDSEKVRSGLTWPVDLQYRTEPDYLFFNATQAELFVVECKGTQSARSSSVEQIRRGTEQVPSLVLTDGRTPPSLIAATCLSRKGTRVLLIDPPGDEEPHKHTKRFGRVDKRSGKSETTQSSVKRYGCCRARKFSPSRERA